MKPIEQFRDALIRFIGEFRHEPRCTTRRTRVHGGVESAPNRPA